MRSAWLAGIAGCTAIVGVLAGACTAAAAPAAQTLHGWVEELSSTAMEGRAPGTEGIEKAARWIAVRFQEVGLEPAGPGGDWYQPFRPEAPRVADAVQLPAGTSWGDLTLKNVAGRLNGRGDGCVLVLAHYDHLGRNAEGALYAGADDNASGIAALCAIAAELVPEGPRRRTVLFLATSGEEEGLLGARAYAGAPLCPLEGTVAVVNLDTVGRMQNDQLFALSAETAREFPEMLRGVNLGFDLALQIPEKSPMASDQIVFLDRGIPGLHFFTGPNEDYHRPTDTAEKVNAEGIARVAGFAAEVVRFLADREGPLSFVPPGADKVAAEAAPRPARRVSLGTLPDFAYAGRGVQLNGVLPNSPAEKAGLRKGDQIVGMDEDEVGDLEEFAAVLRTRAAGDTVRVHFVRGGQTQTVPVVLVERK
jgi:hypothetical protein